METVELLTTLSDAFRPSAIGACTERGLPREAVAVWLYGETLTVTFADESLAQYRVTYQFDQRHLASVSEMDRCSCPRLSNSPTN